MDEAERMRIEWECACIVNRLALLADAYDHDRLIELFDENAVLHHLHLGEIRGKSALADYYANKRRGVMTMHIVTNIVIDVVGTDRAAGRSYWSAYLSACDAPAPARPADTLGRYEDIFVRSRDGWRLASRRQHLLFGHVDVRRFMQNTQVR